MSRATWVLQGQDANFSKLRQYGITAPYYDPRDPRVTAAYLDNVDANGFDPGLYFAWNWYPSLDGKGFAEKCHAELLRVGWQGNPPVCLDIETHDVGYILAALARWRQLRPTRETSWTLEGMQGGLFSPANVREILDRRVRIVPQFYAGNMGALGAGVVLDLLISGFPGERIDGFYDAARLPYRWRGFAFHATTLP